MTANIVCVSVIEDMFGILLTELAVLTLIQVLLPVQALAVLLAVLPAEAEVLPVIKKKEQLKSPYQLLVVNGPKGLSHIIIR